MRPHSGLKTEHKMMLNMTYKNGLFLIFMLLTGSVLWSQPIAFLKVDAGNHQRENTLVSVVISNKLNLSDKCIQLFEITGDGLKPTPFQIKSVDAVELWWVLDGITAKKQLRSYELHIGETPSATAPNEQFVRDATSYLFLNHTHKALKYNFAPAPVPSGVDKAFSRSGYVHPLYSPSGKTLTYIQPPDHIHHYGLWNAWTRTQFETRSVDFWNLGQKQGRVDYIATIHTLTGDIFSSLKALHHHKVVNTDEKNDIALLETLELTHYNALQEVYVTDYTSTYNCVSTQGLFLEEYRYGGFVFRGSETWNPKTVEMLTSEGKNQSNCDDARARWCLVNEIADGGAGILLMSHPHNFNHPEPLRTWEPGANKGEANIFINFSPIRNSSWEMKYGQNYTLRYRIVTFNGKMCQETAEKYWIDFAHPPVVEMSLP